MPSQFEPCGLNQMYSLAYGTVPIVHAVGGLADTVVGLSPKTLADGTANGFSFKSYDAEAFLTQWRRAIETYDDRATWNQLVHNGMQRDWSWESSAAEYVSVYERALASRHEPTATT
jgi:starch synthase